MTIGQKNLYINGITWHCLSVFYARKNNADLLNAINNFHETCKNDLMHLSFYFSDTQGERINIVLILKKNNSESIITCIEQYFEQFLKEKPSENLYPIPYGSVLWLPYPNNSMVWNAFSIPHFLFKSQENRDFARATSCLIANLYDEECSFEENTITIAMFLFVKLCKQQDMALSKVTDSETAKTLQTYWDYEEESLLIEWMKYPHFNTAISIIYTQLDVSMENLNYYLPNLLFKQSGNYTPSGDFTQ